VDNVTHSLIGTALAELALPGAATRPVRRLFVYTGIIAANLPDADLVYTRITPPPLGYLLHHRGHTHTIVGAAALAVVVGLIAFLPGIRRTVAPVRARFWTLVAASLASHLVLDWWNSYGIHPFFPVDNRWYYGDAISIIEPWIWALLGVAAALNATRAWARVTIAGALVALSVMLSRMGWLTLTPALVVIAGAAVFAAIVWRLTPRARSTVALAATALFVAGMFVSSAVARRRVLAAFPPGPGGRIVDVIMSPGTAVPSRWSFIVIEKNEGAGEYVMRRGATRLAWGERISDVQNVRQSLGRLRELDRNDCSVRAWLQFGRAPVIGQGEITDFRFGGAARDNFTTMQLSVGPEAGRCPPNLTDWGRPRRDLLSP
jgi:inner membrane protein